MRTETILVVDDESIVRRLINYCLKRRGYAVLEAASGAEAIETCVAHKGKIDLALVDVVLPGLHGPQLARQLKRLIPEIRVLYMSGFPHVEAINRGMDDFISKPFTIDKFLEQIREALAKSATAPTPELTPQEKRT